MRRNLNSRFLWIVLLLISVGSLLLIAAVPVLPVGKFYALKPTDFTRATGKPFSKTVDFKVKNPNTQYTLVIYNGGADGQFAKKVSSALFWLNGKAVVGPRDFNQKVDMVEKVITPKKSDHNLLKVELRSAPKSGLTAMVIGVDNDLPTISASLDKQPNANGWFNQKVTVSFTCDDMTSDITFCTSPVTVTSEGAGQVVTGTAIDSAQNQASTSVTLNIDLTKPTITAKVDPSPNANGWNNTLPVTVTFECSDALSGIDTCPAPETVTLEGIKNVSGTATDKAGNSSTLVVPVKVDLTVPVVTITNPTGGETINTPSIKVSGTATDTGSGVANVTCKSGTTSAAATLTESSFACEIAPEAGAATLVEVEAVDKAGNSSSASVTVNFSPAGGLLKKKP